MRAREKSWPHPRCGIYINDEDFWVVSSKEVEGGLTQGHELISRHGLADLSPRILGRQVRAALAAFAAGRRSTSTKHDLLQRISGGKRNSFIRHSWFISVWHDLQLKQLQISVGYAPTSSGYLFVGEPARLPARLAQADLGAAIFECLKNTRRRVTLGRKLPW
jgi:hypothetical protein